MSGHCLKVTRLYNGTGLDGDRHSATLSKGQPGVLHGVRTYILQSKVGQIIETHSISAGLDYPGVGPEHAWLKDSGRAEYVVATDEEALRGFRMLTQREGIIPGVPRDKLLSFGLIYSSSRVFSCYLACCSISQDFAKRFGHRSCAQLHFLFRICQTDSRQCLSGRGDKDVEQISQVLPKWADKLGWHVSSAGKIDDVK